ncbi:hypothetical protein GLOTRDRAFT_122780 [Gloeophyllum trabeum ATCC 11539]|uniref:Uncharacterized protein n=1 Tax=Gloeophyllum trabeum (strain ATCC 11539 / FP-39264 / Madison 617) TaxID=670483 RepID=S7RHI2_GLOTA|nr:uncharacterized protein GLOTRDRAFT_122780 [Gloeophyllum trabeum ATCC 11539]EPQ52049.1 hypothetical protein GLOTRDRAFT_122780 [Gloeophyllum trabeum ATCC 11539]
MSSRVPKSKSGVFSGYLIDPDKFKEFVSSLPVEKVWEDEECFGDPYEALIIGYCNWRLQVGRVNPQKKKYLPRIRVRHALPGEPSVTQDRITHMFFATRCVPYKRSSQMDESHPDSQRLREETERDRALFNVFKQTVESEGGKIDRDMVTFGIIRDWHPAHDPFCSMSPPSSATFGTAVIIFRGGGCVFGCSMPSIVYCTRPACCAPSDVWTHATEGEAAAHGGRGAAWAANAQRILELDEKSSEIERLSAELVVSQAREAELVSKIQDMELAKAADASRHEAETTSVRSSLESMQRDVKDLGAQLRVSVAARVKLETEVKNLYAKLDSARSSLEAETARSAAMEKDLRQVTAKIHALQDELERAVAARRAEQSKLATLVSGYNKLRKQQMDSYAEFDQMSVARHLKLLLEVTDSDVLLGQILLEFYFIVMSLEAASSFSELNSANRPLTFPWYSESSVALSFASTAI